MLETVCVFLAGFLINEQPPEMRMSDYVPNEMVVHCALDSGSYTTELPANINFHASHLNFKKHQWDSTYIYTLAALSDMGNQESYEKFLLMMILGRTCHKKGLKAESVKMYTDAYNYIAKDPEKEWLKNRVGLILASELIDYQDYQTAINQLEQVNFAFLDVKNQKSFFHNIGVCYLHLKNYELAETNFLKSLNLKEKHQDTLGLATEYMDIANLYYEQYLDDKAIPLFQKGLEFAELANDDKVLRNAYLNMAVVEENRSDFKKALEYRKEYEKIVKDLWDRDKVWELAEQEKQFEVSLKEKEIALLEEQDRVQKAELQIQKTQRNYSLGAGALLLCIAVAAAIGYQKVQQSNQLISNQRNELEGLNQMKNRLFSIIAHDLKSPVFALQKANRRLSAAIDKGDQSSIRLIAAENEKITESTYGLLNNLLQWSLDQSDQFLIHPEPISVSRIVDQVIYDYTGLIHEKTLILEKDISEDQIALTDLNSLKIVLRNILDNAIKFTPACGQITFLSKRKNEQIYISIEDTGSGMTPETLSRLFAMDDSKITTDSEGRRSTGLGMNLCYSLIKKNAGEIYATSTPGQGTTLTISLPEAISESV